MSGYQDGYGNRMRPSDGDYNAWQQGQYARQHQEAMQRMARQNQELWNASRKKANGSSGSSLFGF